MSVETVIVQLDGRALVCVESRWCLSYGECPEAIEGGRSCFGNGAAATCLLNGSITRFAKGAMPPGVKLAYGEDKDSHQLVQVPSE